MNLYSNLDGYTLPEIAFHVAKSAMLDAMQYQRR
jgi:hypothetical protein